MLKPLVHCGCRLLLPKAAERLLARSMSKSDHMVDKYNYDEVGTYLSFSSTRQAVYQKPLLPGNVEDCRQELFSHNFSLAPKVELVLVLSVAPSHMLLQVEESLCTGRSSDTDYGSKGCSCRTPP